MKFEEWAEGQLGPEPSKRRSYSDLIFELQAARRKFEIAEENFERRRRWEHDMKVARYAWNIKDKDKK